MVVTDPIADMLTRIRNAIMRKHSKVTLPSSKMKASIAQKMVDEGFISQYKVGRNEKGFKVLTITLKYDDAGTSVIRGIQRVSTPGCRQYTSVSNLPVVKNHLGIAILTTSQGLKTNKQCKRDNIGGEVVCYIW